MIEVRGEALKRGGGLTSLFHKAGSPKILAAMERLRNEDGRKKEKRNKGVSKLLTTRKVSNRGHKISDRMVLGETGEVCKKKYINK